MLSRNNKIKAFTLVELLLYVALASVVLSVVAVSLVQLFELRVASRVIFETEAQGEQVLNNIKFELAQAQSVSSPLPANETETVIYQFNSNTKSIYLEQGKLKLEGNEIQDLTTSKVTVTNLKFENLSTGPEYDLISVSFDLTSNDHLSRGGQYTSSFHLTQLVRSIKP